MKGNSIWKNVGLYALVVFSHFILFSRILASCLNVLVEGGSEPLILLIFALVSALYIFGLWKWYQKGWKLEVKKTKLTSTIWLPIGLLVAFIALQALVSGESSNNQRSIEFFLELFPAFFFFYIIFIAPIIEEFITRGLMAKYLFSKQGTLGQTLLYIALSSGLFSFLHLPSSLGQFLTYFIMGSIFALAYLTKEDIRYAIALHIANNLIASLLIFLLQ